tara:strand:+ start:1140 stop:2363 length:1224 start_codon:yes stop_codon:yes gene_type:complete
MKTMGKLVYKRKKHYYFRYTINGKRKSQPTGQTNEKKAIAWAIDFKKKLDNPEPIVKFQKTTNPLTFEHATLLYIEGKLGMVLPKFRKTAKGEIKLKTLHDQIRYIENWSHGFRYHKVCEYFMYKSKFNNFPLKRGGLMKIVDINMNLLNTTFSNTSKKISESYRAWRSQQKVTKNGVEINQYISPATINREIGFIRGILNYVYLVKEIRPVMHRGHWKELFVEEKVRPKTTLTIKEEEALYKVLDNYHNKHLKEFIRFSILLAQRKSMNLNLKIKDLDFDAKTIHFYNSKRSKPHVLPMTKEIYTILKRLIGNRYDPEEPVFTYMDKAYKNPTTGFKKALKEAGITKNIRIHDLRHTGAERLASKTQIIQIQKILDHSTITTTQIYANSGNDEQVLEALETISGKN